MCIHLGCMNASALYQIFVVVIVVCIALLTVKLGACFQLIKVVSTHPYTPSLHTCVFMSSDDLFAEPDSSIPLRLSLRS